MRQFHSATDSKFKDIFQKITNGIESATSNSVSGGVLSVDTRKCVETFVRSETKMLYNA